MSEKTVWLEILRCRHCEKFAIGIEDIRFGHKCAGSWMTGGRIKTTDEQIKAAIFGAEGGSHWPEVRDWKTIESAPKDKVILTFAIVDTETGNWNMRTSYYISEPFGDCFHWNGWSKYGAQPTHWMALPKPPYVQQ